jgi:hypothetical protein
MDPIQPKGMEILKKVGENITDSLCVSYSLEN